MRILRSIRGTQTLWIIWSSQSRTAEDAHMNTVAMN